MRGSDQVTSSLCSYVDLEERVPARHPLRKIRAVINDALRSLMPTSTGSTRVRAVPRSRPNG